MIDWLLIFSAHCLHHPSPNTIYTSGQSLLKLIARHSAQTPFVNLQLMEEKPVKFSVVDAFTDKAFKGNPAAVCLLEEERDEEWLQAVAMEFNVSATCYLTCIHNHDETDESKSNPRFNLRWFTPVAEVELCGHATLAAAHVLFGSGLVKSNVIEFLTLSGILTAEKIDSEPKVSNCSSKEDFTIELDFPTVSVIECDPTNIPSIPLTLNGASIINIKKTSTTGFVILELASGQIVAELEPHFDELLKCSAGGVIITGSAPHGSEFDFFSRFFCPKLGINEDPVCGSAHCALAPYWRTKLGKNDFLAYMASPRGGVLDLHLDEDTQRVKIRGKAVTVMEGSVFA